jgi:hypothetical protein
MPTKVTGPSEGGAGCRPRAHSQEWLHPAILLRSLSAARSYMYCVAAAPTPWPFPPDVHMGVGIALADSLAVRDASGNGGR